MEDCGGSRRIERSRRWRKKDGRVGQRRCSDKGGRDGTRQHDEVVIARHGNEGTRLPVSTVVPSRSSSDACILPAGSLLYLSFFFSSLPSFPSQPPGTLVLAPVPLHSRSPITRFVHETLEDSNPILISFVLVMGHRHRKHRKHRCFINFDVDVFRIDVLVTSMFFFDV